MNAEQKKMDEQNERSPDTLADLPVNNPKEESIAGGSLNNNQHGTHVAGTIGSAVGF